SVNNEFLVTLRGDYGATWDGDIEVRRVVLKLYRDRYSSVFFFSTTANDVKLPLVLGRKIILEDITFDYSLFPSSTNVAIPVSFGDRAKNDNGDRYMIPSMISMKNIKVVGRTKGIKLLTSGTTFGEFKTEKSGSIEGDYVRPNVNIYVENVDSDELDTITCSDSINYESEYYPVIDFNLRNSPRIDVNVGN